MLFTLYIIKQTLGTPKEIGIALKGKHEIKHIHSNSSTA